MQRFNTILRMLRFHGPLLDSSFRYAQLYYYQRRDLGMGQMTVNDCQTFGGMLESIEKVSSVIARYSELESRVLIRTSALTKQLSIALVKLYAATLKYLAHGRRYYKQSTLSKHTIRLC
jgi:hypothetical protein